MVHNLAPIIVFAFNRPEALRNTIHSLLRNTEAQESELYVFVDGARPDKPGETEKVKDVQEYVKSIKGFKNVHYTFSERNKGLGASIIQGVTAVINQYGKVIVLEDDLVFSENFLAFMNEGLRRYERESRVFSVCGYGNKVKVPDGYAGDAYFCARSSSWGWATWADRWNSVDWELKDWDKYARMRKAFNRWGGSDCFGMLKDWKQGKNQSWAIRFCFSQFLQDKWSLFPVTSKVRNDGFDGMGTNCKRWSRFRYVFDETKSKNFALPQEIEINKQLYQSAMAYHGILVRIYSRLMYWIH